MKTIIRNGTVITAEQTVEADILIEGGLITAIGPALEAEADQIIDAAGKYVLPGGVDAHVHLDLPMFGTVSSDDHYTGGKAAAFGGTTTLIDFISQDEGTLNGNIDRWHAKAEKSCIDIGAHMNITHWDNHIRQQLAHLPQRGITSIKVFTAYNNRLRLNDGDIYKAMRMAGTHGILTLVHAENGDVIDVLVAEALAKNRTQPIWHARTRPAWGEVEASLRAVALGAQAGAPVYLVHMNVAGEVDQLGYGRSKGVKVMGETCPQYLFFSEKELERPDGSKWICSPPMRKEEDQAALWKGLEDGTIQVLATDHCPFFYDGTKPINYEGEEVRIPGKELGKADFTAIPNGLPGVGDRLPVFWTKAVQSGRISPNRFVELTATNPAKIFGLYPRKGTLAVGSDADIAIWDPNLSVDYGVKVAQHRTDYNLYEGWQLTGFPELVMQRGQILVSGREWHGKAGQGQFLHRKTGEVL